jgi:hypothetical protein
MVTFHSLDFLDHIIASTDTLLQHHDNDTHMVD